MTRRFVIPFLTVLLLLWIVGCSNSPMDSWNSADKPELGEGIQRSGGDGTSGAEVCETKEKCLEIAGCITITTSFCNVSVGETVTIEIVSANGTLASGEPVSIKHVTPKRGAASISQTRVSDKEVTVTLDDCFPGAKTVHLNVFVDTGEKIGVNLQLVREVVFSEA